MTTIFIIVVWVLTSVAVGYRADLRGRDFVGWIFLSLLISPLVAAFILFLLPARARLGPATTTQDPRWANLRALTPDMEAQTKVEEATRQAAVEARRRREDRQAVIGSIIAVGLILSLFLVFYLNAQ